MTGRPLAPNAARELRGWALAAIAALAVSGVLAPMLALSRAPGMDAYLPWAEQAFVRAIIEHVVFSVVVWTFAVFGGLMAIAAHDAGAGKGDWLGRAGLWLMLPAFVLLFAPGMMESAEPSLNNYVPVMIHPLYYWGVAVLFAALALPALRLLLGPATGSRVRDGAYAAALTYGIALACVAIAWVSLGGAPVSVAYNEDLFWGGGHALQAMNALLLLTAWAVLGDKALGRPFVAEGPYRIALGAALLAAFACALLYAAFPIDGGHLREAQSKLKFFLVIPTGLFGLAVLPNLIRGLRMGAMKDPAFTAVVLSMALFGVGGVMGYFADGTDTRTPGHYHAVLGGVNLAFFGLVMFYFLPLLGRSLKPNRWRFAPLYIYALGQALQSVGMFVAEAPRKTMGQAQMLETAIERFGMELNKNGALIAVIGGILFVWIVGRALLRRSPSNVT